VCLYLKDVNVFYSSLLYEFIAGFSNCVHKMNLFFLILWVKLRKQHQNFINYSRYNRRVLAGMCVKLNRLQQVECLLDCFLHPILQWLPWHQH
jgi:hypothetical protein